MQVIHVHGGCKHENYPSKNKISNNLPIHSLYSRHHACFSENIVLFN